MTRLLVAGAITRDYTYIRLDGLCALMSIANKDVHPLSSLLTPSMKDTRDGYDELVYVFQGGGALGVFQFGAYQALHESGYRPTWLCGISIGSINASIIAGNPPDKVLSRLEEFWSGVSIDLEPWSSWFTTMHMHRYIANVSAQLAISCGIPNFCSPNAINPWFIPEESIDKISFYDSTLLRQTLEHLIDFDYLNSSHTRLSLGAFDVAAGELVFFDNNRMTLTVDHILASCAIPPGMPAVKIGSRYYWDGGVYFNSPFTSVLSEVKDRNVLCIMVNNFPSNGDLPSNMSDILLRLKDLRYNGHTHHQMQVYSTIHHLRNVINQLIQKMTEEQKKDDDVKSIVDMGLGCVGQFHVARLVYRSPSGMESENKDYEFSQSSLRRRFNDGYQHTRELLLQSRQDWLEQLQSGSPKVCLQDVEQEVFCRDY